MYDALLQELVDEAREDEQVIGLLLTGSVARGDALPGTDIDLRYIMTDGAGGPFTSASRDGVLLERTYLDLSTAQADLAGNPMHVYAYLDGRILFDNENALAQLRKQALDVFEEYRTSAEQLDRIDFLLMCAYDKIRVGMDAGDWLRAAFATATTSWQIMDGLWAACNRPVPPHSSVRPHLCDLAPFLPDIEDRYRRLFLGDTEARAREAIWLIEWIRARLS